ncbi:hypothetical protein [Chengkuizengella marina]|uniref:Uncharacterized protein n=1 Tax=Chengkuizengella marina TaxID=2507566 RepID=A0A6N9Q7Z8_9BACL|nr:hypothetical protein [Chengkuizengella marina]NBI30988.1 hypothetical protein [Chengkuizengella marina]
MNNIRLDIQKQFYKVYKGHISVLEFEKWLYTTQEIEIVFGQNFYYSFLDLNYRNKYVINELKKLIKLHFIFDELEHNRILTLLNNLVTEKGDAIEILEEIYYDYCNGYTFLEYLSVTYISEIDNIPMNDIDFYKKRESLENKKSYIKNEANRLISYFKDGKLKITDEYKFNDDRNEEEK